MADIFHILQNFRVSTFIMLHSNLVCLFGSDKAMQIRKIFSSCFLKSTFFLLLVSCKLCPLARTALIIIVIITARRGNTLKTLIRLEDNYKQRNKEKFSARGTDLCASGGIQHAPLLSKCSRSHPLINLMYDEQG